MLKQEANGIRALVFSAPASSALTNGTITVTFGATAPAEKAATFFFVDGLTVPAADRSTLDSHASRLRRKLSRDGREYVINEWGVGYRLVGD